MFVLELCTLITILLSIALVWFLTRNFSYWKKRGVPYEKPTILFGNMFEIVLGRDTPGNYLATLYNKTTGPYCGLFGMDEPFLLIKDTSIIKQIFVQDFKKFPEKCHFNDESIDPIFSRSVFAMKMPDWHVMRTKLSSAFSSGRIKLMTSLVLASGQNMCRYLDTKAGIEIENKEMASKYTTDAVVSCAFGIELNSFLDENAMLRQQSRKFFEEKFTRVIPSLSYIFASSLVKVLRLKFIEPKSGAFFRDILVKSLNLRRSSNFYRNDIMDALISLQKSEMGNKFNDDVLLAQAITFYVAGVGTTSSEISFTLLELAVNPQMQDRLRREILDVLLIHKEVTYDAIQEMEYLHMVYCESLRKYPATTFIHRRCIEKCTIKKTGLTIEPGLGIIVALQGLHFDPKYFPDPEQFDPERFSKTNKAQIAKYSYAPFGIGPRSCMGEKLAMLIFKAGIIQILANYQVERTINTIYPVRLGSSYITQPVGGVSLKFKKL